MTNFKPMLAGKYDEAKIKFPVIAQPKLDGIRASVVDGKLVSRSLKPIPNSYIRSCLEQSQYEGLDGELIVRSPTDADCFRTTTSAVMSEAGTSDFAFWVFDKWKQIKFDGNITPNPSGYEKRWQQIGEGLGPRIVRVPYEVVYESADLDKLEADWTALGYEGVILRSPDQPYKFGRGTASKGDLLKLKRFVDFEATVVGFVEEQANLNEAKTNALGRTERSSAKAGKEGKDTLGKLICRRQDGVEFGVGTGFTAADRKAFWESRDELVGKTVKIKSFPIGEHEKPRFPTFMGFRHADDIS